MQKIAMFGGSFNPIHNGHIQMALGFAEILALDKILVIPSNIPPHKPCGDIIGAQDRLEMCRIAAKPYPVLQVSDIEIMRKGRSYTVDTLRQLSVLYPDARLYLITGADMFLTIQNWKNAEEIFRLATICAAPREKNNIFILQKQENVLKLKHVQCEVVNIPLIPVSSTQVRQCIKKGTSIEHMVPHEVARYICEHNLYRE